VIPQNLPVNCETIPKIDYGSIMHAKIWTEVWGFFFGPPCLRGKIRAQLTNFCWYW